MAVRRQQASGSSQMRTSLVVLGMHHSGGDMLAAALAQCGARHVNRDELRDVCNGLLRATGAGWRVLDNAHGTRVFEEPQLCLLFHALQHHIPDPVCIHVYRNPIDVAHVLQAATGIEVAEGLELWEAYNASALRSSKRYARVFVRYEELVLRPEECLGKLLRELGGLGVQGLETPGGGFFQSWGFQPDPFGGAAAQQEREEAGDGLTSGQDRLWRELSLGMQDEESAQSGAGRQALENAHHGRTAQVADLKSKVKEQASEIDILNQRVAWLDAQVLEFQASQSWRITAPLRAVSNTMRKMRARLGGRKHSIRQGHREPARPPTTLEGQDTFVLYRIIGNDLHPRHKRGQAVENLRFIIAYEPALEHCEKRFVLNRILDAEQEKDIIGLLDQAGFGYFRIPFDPGEYAKAGFDTDILPEPDFLSGQAFDALDDAGKSRLLGALYRHKNNYVMNNNGARNAALEDGRSRARWILPWDGNCFVNRDAWAAIRRDVAKAPTNRYFIVPMARMLTNAPLVEGGAIPEAVEEPQVIFRTDAEERFNAAFCYGRRPKVELLWRLGVRGPWDAYPDDPWDQVRSPLSPDATVVGKAGWVARLSSGMSTLEANSHHAPLHRGLARSGAVLATLRNLDVRLAGADSEQPVSIRPNVLRQEVALRDAAPLSGVVDALLRAADEALAVAENSGITDLQRGFEDSMVLALAWSFTGGSRYVERGSDILERLFVDPGARAEARQRELGPGAGLHGGGGELYYYLDAVRMFESAGSVGEATKEGSRAWLAARLEWLSTSPEGRAERAAGDHRGTLHDLQVASIASFLDDQALLYDTLVRAQARIRSQFAPRGRQPGEAEGASALHWRCYNFQAWIHLAELGSRWGVDLWGYQAPDGATLAQGARWLLAGAKEARSPEQAGAFDVERLQPIRFGVREFVDLESGEAESTPYAAKPRFPPACGIRPFWNLASYGHPGHEGEATPTCNTLNV